MLDDARERMVLSSCSVFRLVVHPLMLPSVHNRESALQRHRTIEKACCTAMLEIRLALREGDEKFARARELLGRGHFQDAAAQLKLVQLCYEYADCIEREANVFFEARSNLVLFDEGTAEETAKIDQIQQVHADIDIMFKDSTRGVWPLHKAASQGAIGTIRYLIQNFGERVDAVDRAGKTALHVAVENDQLETTRVLIQDFGADPSRRTFTGRTPIHIASDHGHADMVRGLFEGCAAVITDEVTKGLRRALDKQGIAREALVVLGAWKDTDHANNALALAAHKLHTVCLHVCPTP